MRCCVRQVGHSVRAVRTGPRRPTSPATSPRQSDTGPRASRCQANADHDGLALRRRDFASAAESPAAATAAAGRPPARRRPTRRPRTCRRIRRARPRPASARRPGHDQPDHRDVRRADDRRLVVDDQDDDRDGHRESTADESSSTTDPDTTTGVEPGGGMCKVDGDCKLRATPDQRQRCRVPSAWQMCRASGQAMRRAGLG